MLRVAAARRATNLEVIKRAGPFERLQQLQPDLRETCGHGRHAPATGKQTADRATMVYFKSWPSALFWSDLFWGLGPFHSSHV
jgi:hypothetical protein